MKTNWNTVEQMIADGDVESIEVVNKEQANVRLRSEAVEKYAARPEYKNIPRRGTQFVFNIGDVATFRQDLDRAEEQYGQAVLLTYETKHNIWLDVLGFLPLYPADGLLHCHDAQCFEECRRRSGGVFNVGKAEGAGVRCQQQGPCDFQGCGRTGRKRRWKSWRLWTSCAIRRDRELRRKDTRREGAFSRPSREQVRPSCQGGGQ